MPQGPLTEPVVYPCRTCSHGRELHTHHPRHAVQPTYCSAPECGCAVWRRTWPWLTGRAQPPTTRAVRELAHAPMATLLQPAAVAVVLCAAFITAAHVALRTSLLVSYVGLGVVVALEVRATWVHRRDAQLMLARREHRPAPAGRPWLRGARR